MRRLARLEPLGIMTLVVMLLVLTARFADAHDVGITSVARVFIDQVGEGRYVLSIVDSGLPSIGDSPGVLPSGCRRTPEEEAAGTVPGFRFQCDEELTFDDVILTPRHATGSKRRDNRKPAPATYLGPAPSRLDPLRVADPTLTLDAPGIRTVT